MTRLLTIVLTITVVSWCTSPAPAAPPIETADADFNVLGVQMRGYHDFGVALQAPSAPRVEKVPFTWKRGGIREVA